MFDASCRHVRPRGRVTDEDTGKPVAEARVLIVTVNGRTIRANPYSRQTGADGSFEFTGLPAASYVLEVAPRVELLEGAHGKLDAPILPADRIAEEVAKVP